MKYKFINLLLVLLGVLFLSGRATAQEETRDFQNPAVNGLRLDWCKHWGRDCGEPAATLWCQEQGYERASAFEMAPNIGGPNSPTVVFGDGALCNQGFCNGFKSVQCARPGTPAPPQIQRTAPTDQSTVYTPPAETTEPETEQPDFTFNPNLIITPEPEEKGPVTYQQPEPTGVIIRSATLDITLVMFANPERFGGQAGLTRCIRADCEFEVDASLKINPVDESQWISFKGYYDDVTDATAAVFEVSTRPFMGVMPAAPEDIVRSGQLEANGEFSVNFAEARQAAGFVPNSFYVRVLALDGPGGNLVGVPSTTIRVFYADPEPPPDTSFQFIEDEVLSRTPAPELQLVAFEYEAYRYIDKWPNNCKPIPRDTGTSGVEAVGKELKKTWDFVSDSYTWAKDAVVDIADSMTLGALPKSVWSVALDGALVSVGIPPDIPNLNEVMSGGVDYFAKEVAKQAVAQIPAADLAATTGNLVADISIDAAAGMAEEELRHRLEDELERQSRQALLDGARAFEEEIRKNGDKIYCRSLSIFPIYKITVRNMANIEYRDVTLTVRDEREVFQAETASFNIRAGETITIPIMPDPKIRIVQRSQLQAYDDSANRANWWNEIYEKWQTRISLYALGEIVCVDPLGPQTYRCSTNSQKLYGGQDWLVLNENMRFR